MIERLALGTVQFGLRYGITNRRGQPTRDETAHIVRVARAAGIDTLDTAMAYGESHERLGEIGVGQWRVVTKLLPIPDGVQDVGVWVADLMKRTLGLLRIPSVAALLVHRPADLLGANGAALAMALQKEREEGRAEKIGVSIYDPGDLDASWSRTTVEVVQAPFSVFDRRLESSGWLRRLHAEGVEIHARSTFLQGLLLMPPEERPRQFARWDALWTHWSAWVDASGTSPLLASLGHSLSYPEISRVVVGVDDAAQLCEILTAAAAPRTRAPTSLATEDAELLEPSRWKAA